VQRAILAVLGGPLDGSRAVVAPGHKLRVGSRAPRADFVVPDDSLAGVHFTGFIAKHLNSTDITLFVGLLVTSVAYLLLSRGFKLSSEEAAIEESERELRLVFGS